MNSNGDLKARRPQLCCSFRPWPKFLIRSQICRRFFSTKKILKKSSPPHLHRIGSRKSRCITEVLPDDILTDILSRLPAESVCVCRCVCKTFLTLTNHHNENPSFAKLHFSRSRTQCLVQPKTLKPFLHLADYHSVIRPHGVVQKHATFRGWDDFRIVNSCNGFVCLVEISRGEDIVVYNPVTREYTMLPWTFVMCTQSVSLGFGHCPETNRYKVLRLFTFVEIAAIHVLGDNSWRFLESAYPCGLKGSRQAYLKPMFVSGCLHWECGKHGIVSFAIKTEMFGEVPLPTHFVEIHKEAMRVSVFRDRLSVTDFTIREHSDVWVMKEYGNQKSWSKQFVIDGRGLHLSYVTPNFHPFDCLRSGELLMQYGDRGGLICYDFHRKCFRHLQFYPDLSDHWGYDIYLYTPSFASLKDVVPDVHVKALDACSRSDQTSRKHALFLSLTMRKRVEDGIMLGSGWTEY